MAVAPLPRSDSALAIVGPAFLEELQLREYAPGTLKIYRWSLDKLFTFLESQGVDDLADLTRDHLRAWQLQLLQGNITSSSRSSASSSAKALIRWASELEMVDWRLERAILPVRVKKRKRRPLPKADLMRILAHIVPRDQHRTIVELRDGALFVYLLVTGSRVDAALHVRKDDYVSPIVIQKGGNEKQLNTTATALDLVLRYLRARRDDSPWLWIKHGNNLNAAGERLESSGVREAWIRLCIELQIKPFTTHQLRHTSATFMANRGVSPFAIKERLGHVKLETTMGYIEVDEELQREADVAFEDLLHAAPLKPLRRAPRRSWTDYTGR
jgi:site-specific recombinase XerD